MALFVSLLLLCSAIASVSEAQPIREVQPVELNAVTSLPTGSPIDNVEEGDEEAVLAPAFPVLPFFTIEFSTPKFADGFSLEFE